MFTSHKRAFARKRAVAPVLLAASALVTGTLLTGCSGDSSAASSGKESSASPTSPFDQGLAYSKCMRENGAPDYPDPQQDTGGVRLTPGEGANPNSESFKKAEEACRDKAPQGLGGGGGGGAALDSEKVSAWATCLRKNGLPKFPDPEIEGSNMKIDINGTGITPGSAEFTKAMGACQSKYPGGGMMMNNGQGGGVPQ
ncbi:hypothetical protein ABZ921_33240 [Streptomyces atriruber]|uniref:Lipoprotein n=1 Tax=Streptomyces atriruber TaxID=545121 RepID=A0ABV3BWW7_9ACTN